MPIYEYRRPDGSTFEVLQSFSDDPLAMDPDSGVPVERVFHAPAVHFKGKGFYNTDYGTRKRQRETASASGGSTSGDSSSGGSSDSSSTGDSASKGDSTTKSDPTTKSDSASGSGSGKNESKPAAKSDAKTVAAK